MDRDRLARRRSNLHLRDERGLLRRDVRVVEMVVVEPDFTNGEAARIPHQRLKLCKIFAE